MLKKLLMVMALCVPVVAAAADRAKDAPVTHLTDEQIYEELKKLALVFEVARDNFVEEADEKKMLEGAMAGMLGALDPHSSYLSADDFKEFSDKSHGEFGGLGIQITSDRGAVRVIAPIDDTPAARAGIKPGDYITHIDDEDEGPPRHQGQVDHHFRWPGTAHHHVKARDYQGEIRQIRRKGRR